MKEKFIEDLQRIYDELQSRQQELNSYYKLLEGEHPAAEEQVDRFLNKLGLPHNEETTLAALTRMVNLREDAIDQVMQKAGLSHEEVVAKREAAYQFVRDMHLLRHEYFIAWIKGENLLTPFYQALIEGVHRIGEVLSFWQSKWTAHIIEGVNRELSETYNGNDQAVLEMLEREGLLDLDPNGHIGDRCYTVLQRDDQGHYRSIAYSEAFPEEVGVLISTIEDCIEELSCLQDEVYNQKVEWIEYLVLLKKAFATTEPRKLIGHWANVDRAWMKITTPIQIGHPLEYYEDHYRKAVALEWDLRIINPQLHDNSSTRESIKNFSTELAHHIEGEVRGTINKNRLQIDETQLYIGQPMLYYAAEFNGLFSAQVVPNDEQVSSELGKKIFAYADFVLASQKAKPMMQLSVETLGEEFVRQKRALAEQNPQLWHQIYDLSTVGHEFGHILWIDSDTESIMNHSGQFKNIEEFKATAGGLMAFFDNEKEELKKHMIDDLVSRSIGLMAWREVGEVLPYYCEGLIHLDILFKSGVIHYEDRIHIDYSRYDAMKAGYQTAYKALAQHYIDKADANAYLTRYASKEGSAYLPTDSSVRRFVDHYYTRYQEIGQHVYREEQLAS